MSLDRKPLQDNEKPEYPNADEYSTDRRTFLIMLGATAVAAAGVYAVEKTGILKGKSVSGTGNSGSIAGPQAHPSGDIVPVSPQVHTGGKPMAPQQPPAAPQAVVKGEMPAVQPQAAPAGKIAPTINHKLGQVRTVQPEPRVQPQAAAEGDVVDPRMQEPEARPVRPALPGAVKAPQPKQPAAPAVRHLRGRVAVPRRRQLRK